MLIISTEISFFLRGLKTSCDRSAQNKQITDASRFLVFLTEYLPKNSQILSVGRIQVLEQVSPWTFVQIRSSTMSNKFISQNIAEKDRFLDKP